MPLTKSGQRRVFSLSSQAVALAGATGIAQLLLAAIYVFAARSLGPADFGYVAASVGLATTIAGISDFGSNNFLVRELASQRMSTRALQQRTSGRLFYYALGTGVWTVFATLTGLPIAPALLALAIAANQMTQVALRGEAQNHLVAVLILLERVVAGVVCAILAYAYPGWATWLPEVLTISAFAAACAGSILSRAPIITMSAAPHFRPWRGSGFFGLAAMAGNAQTADVPLLVSVSDSAEGGTYGAVSRWTQPMGLLASAYASASAPYIAKAKSLSEAWGYMRRGSWLLVLGVLTCCMVAALAHQVVTLLIGPEFKSSANVLLILALGTIVALANQPAVVLLQGLGHDRSVAVASVSGAVLQLVLVAILGLTLGAVGAAIAFAALQIWMASSFLLILWNRRETL